MLVMWALEPTAAVSGERQRDWLPPSGHLECQINLMRCIKDHGNMQTPHELWLSLCRHPGSGQNGGNLASHVCKRFYCWNISDIDYKKLLYTWLYFFDDINFFIDLMRIFLNKVYRYVPALSADSCRSDSECLCGGSPWASSLFLVGNKCRREKLFIESHYHLESG